MRAVRGGGERSEVEGSDQKWRGAIRGGGERSEVEGRDQRSEVDSAGTATSTIDTDVTESESGCCPDRSILQSRVSKAKPEA